MTTRDELLREAGSETSLKALLEECFIADFDKGTLVWKVRPESHFKNKGAMKRCNASCAGKTAFTALNKDGYYHGIVFRKAYILHRLIWFLYYGKWPSGQIDHINRNRRDNRICNLRDVSNRENSKNRSLQKNNTSGFTGVVWKENVKKWSAAIRVQGRQKHLGSFDKIEDAILAREIASAVYGYNRI
jgi:hypothetical protein